MVFFDGEGRGVGVYTVALLNNPFRIDFLELFCGFCTERCGSGEETSHGTNVIFGADGLIVYELDDNWRDLMIVRF